MYWLRVALVLRLVVHSTAEESQSERNGAYTGSSDEDALKHLLKCLMDLCTFCCKTLSPHEPLRHLVESLLERIEHLAMTVKDNVGDLKRKDTRIGHMEQELHAIKIASLIPQYLVDTIRLPEIPDRNRNLYRHLKKPRADTTRQNAEEMSDNDGSSKSIRVSLIASEAAEAFSVSLSRSINLHPHLVLVFDEVLLDVGVNYNLADGVYTVPHSGVYVFTWVITGTTTADVITELVVNGSPRAATFADAKEGMGWDSSTGLVVTLTSAGDHVFVRSKVSGSIKSDDHYGKAMFSGWRLS